MLNVWLNVWLIDSVIHRSVPHNHWLKNLLEQMRRWIWPAGRAAAKKTFCI